MPVSNTLASPATVRAGFGDGSTGDVAVVWDAVDPASYAAPGEFVVQGTVSSGSADRPTATVTVRDAADPTVALTALPDGAGGWWVSDPATVAVSAADDTGVDSVQTAVDTGTWVRTPGSLATVSVAGDGRHVVTARALDSTGNQSPIGSLDVNIDTTAPVSRASYDASRVVTVRAADSTSGVARVEVRVGDGSWTTYTGPVPVGAAGATVQYRAVDVAGNIETTNALVVPDASPDLEDTAVAAVLSDDTVPYGTAVPVNIRVTGAESIPTGVVRVLAGDRLLAAGELSDGRLRMVVDTEDLGAIGDHPLVVRYDGDAGHDWAQDALVLTVTKAGSTTAVTLLEPGADGLGGQARIRVTTTPAGQAPDQVRVTLLRSGTAVATDWVTLDADGRARWALPKLRKGSYEVRVVTPAGPTLEGSSARAQLVLGGGR